MITSDGKLIPQGLCWRCEYRIQFLEKGHGPRMECGMLGCVKHGCYQYAPVKPCVLKVCETELLIKGRPARPPVGGYFGARMTFDRVFGTHESSEKSSDGYSVVTELGEGEYVRVLLPSSFYDTIGRSKKRKEAKMAKKKGRKGCK